MQTQIRLVALLWPSVIAFGSVGCQMANPHGPVNDQELGYVDLHRAVAAAQADDWGGGDIEPTAAYYRKQSINWEKIDLNGDGIDEAICSPTHAAFDSETPHSVKGATGNGPCFIFQDQNGRWIQIANISGEMHWIDERHFNGWSIVITDWDKGGHERGREIMAFDGAVYQSVHRYSIRVGEQ